MIFKDRMRGVALVVVLIFMLLITIIAGAVLSIMTKQARLAEHQIRRIKGFYAAESAINKAYQSLRCMNTTAGALVAGQANQGAWVDVVGSAGVWRWNWNNTSGQGFEWNVDNEGTLIQTKNIDVSYNTSNHALTAEVDYAP